MFLFTFTISRSFITFMNHTKMSEKNEENNTKIYEKYKRQHNFNF